MKTKWQKLLNIALLIKVCMLIILPLSSNLFAAEDESEKLGEQHKAESVRLYRNPEERREAGRGTKLTEWLSFSGLVELERERIKNIFNNDIEGREYEEPILTLKIGLKFAFNEWLSGELLFESERNSHFSHTFIEESTLKADFEKGELSVGRQNLPFGKYYSNFITDPMIQFGETRTDAFVANYFVMDSLRISGYLFDSDVSSQGGDNKVDWGFAIDFKSADESIRMGASYLHDLAESDEQLLGEFNNVYKDRVSGSNAYVLMGINQFEFTAEAVRTNGQIKEFEENVNSPSAYNVELAYFPSRSTQLAVRIERSDQLVDRPERQYGIVGSWRPGKYLSVSIEYLYGKYKPGLVVDDDENVQRTRKLFAGKVSFEF
ncbi:LbtU family siderophore porin [Pseudomonadota bacterium]